MIVLDTHVLVWWVSDPDKVSKRVQKVINAEVKTGQILVSSISVWEIYLLVKKRKLGFSIDIDSWMQKLESMAFLEFVPVDNRIAAKAVMLPDPLHSDPADRIIIATAREVGAQLATSDKKILSYRHVRSIW